MNKIESGKNLSILILGGKPALVKQSLAFESSRTDGHKLFIASRISHAWRILQTESIDQITIEAFMDNDGAETPFHFLPMLKASRHSQIPVFLIAAEPSVTGSFFSDLVERATVSFGAKFLLIDKFRPEEVRSAVSALQSH